MELVKVYAALLRRKWLFLQAVLFFTIGAGVLAKLLPKKYEAAAKISVQTSSAASSILGEMDLGEIATSLSNSSDDMETMMALAEMRPILDEVIWRLQLRNQYLSNWGDGELLPAEKLLAPGIDGSILAMPMIELDDEQGTNVITVTATTTNPELSALLADTLVDVYLAKSMEAERKDTHDAGEFVTKKLVDVQKEFDQALANIADAQEREQVIDLDSETKAAVARVSDLISSRTSIDAQMADVQAQMRQRGIVNERESSEKVAPSSIASNDQVRQLREAITNLQQKRSEALFDKTAKHPDVQLLEKQINEAKAQLSKALAESHELDSMSQGLEVQMAGLKKRRDEVNDEIGKTIAEFGAYPEKMRKIGQLQLAADATQSIYRNLLEQQYQIAVAEALTVSSMRQVEYAKAPEVPAAPKVLVYIILGLFCGVGFGFGLVFLMEYIDDSVKSQEDVRLVWPLPVMGMVPHYKLKTGSLIDQVPLTDPIFESFRNIRNSIAFASVDNPINVLTVTSCAPGEGKSTFSMNLAICLAQDGQRVVVVDCDLRRPTQHRMFPSLANDRGVSQVLAQQQTVDEVLQGTPIPGLSVLTAGPLPSNPGRMVESLRLRQLISELSKRFDMVIVDAPPLLAVGDAFALGRASRGMMMVVEWGKTTRRMLTDVRLRYQGAGMEPVGIVFNKVDTRQGGYGYYKSYANYYSKAGDNTPRRQRGGGK